MAVVGTSGSGKSSLVRAGLLPDLYCGYLARHGIGLGRHRDRARRRSDRPARGEVHRGRMARRGRRAAHELDPDPRSCAIGTFNPDSICSVLVDQLEELFRLKTSDDPVLDSDEKASFVRSAAQCGWPAREVAERGQSTRTPRDRHAVRVPRPRVGVSAACLRRSIRANTSFPGFTREQLRLRDRVPGSRRRR